ncbi:hypothetical protein BCAMP_08961 [Brochothrix campestris FSL F6-1037]|uniref:YdhG-like domain-containing protein n=1 Tax=Brochothrix campestris FSL F6-1037 TaxID=1265861 RepID=W7CG63_9LIST|nr:hypothetical protein BCAMP_08961 [Brochothrix campestris FSL F6-1037]
MAVFEAYIADLPAEHQGRVSEVLNWIATTYPQLEQEIKWKQPMFIDHGTFIIAFSVAKHHLAVAPKGRVSFISQATLLRQTISRAKNLCGLNGSKLLIMIC